MASTSEVGHAKNVANLQKLIEQITVYTKYNPSVEVLKIPSLQTLYDNSLVELDNVKTKKDQNKTAKYARQAAFEDVKSTSTKIVNQLDILNLEKGKLEQSKSINREIQGTKLKKTPKEDPPKEGDDKEISTSRQSFTSIADNFGTLVQIAAAIPEYNPNEEELKITNLTQYHKALESTTKDVDTTEAQLNNQLTTRNKLFYAEDTGLYDISQDVKKYVKSAYGSDSPEFSNVSSIKFTDLKE